MVYSKCSAMTVLASLLLLGCATRAPIEETRFVLESFDMFNTAAQPMLDQLAAVERSEKIRKDLEKGQLLTDNSRVHINFVAEDAVYYTSLDVDPPFTDSLRRGLAALHGYVELLLYLAEGKNLDEFRGQLQSLQGLLMGPPVGGEAAKEALEKITGLVVNLAAQQNIRALKTLVLKEENRKTFVEVIALLKKNSTLVQKTLSAPYVRVVQEDMAAGLDPIAEADKVRQKVELIQKPAARMIDIINTTVADYTELLDNLHRSHDLLANALGQESYKSSGNILTQAADIKGKTERWRRDQAIGAVTTTP